MLHPAEVGLAARDPAIPGLVHLLDPEAFADLLRRGAPDACIRGAAPLYVRYKPGTRCLAGYRVALDSESTLVYAVAHGPDGPAKIEKRRTRAPVESGLALGTLIFAELGITVHVFPDDGALRCLPRLADPARQERLLRRVLPDRPELWRAELETLAYKPERRLVARVAGESGAPALLKFYTPLGFRTARAAAEAFRSRGALRVAAQAGGSKRHGVLAFEWIAGELLRDRLGTSSARTDAALAGAALAELHLQPAPKPGPGAGQDASRVLAAAEPIGVILPPLAERARKLAHAIARRLERRVAPRQAVHGDLYANQILIGDGRAAILDLDRARAGDPASDLGLLRAHLERDVVQGRQTADRVETVVDALLAGYGEVAPPPDRHAVDLQAAAGLLSVAVHHFRHREPEWPERMEATLDRADSLLARAPQGSGPRGAAGPGATPPRVRARSWREDAAVDPDIPFLAEALDGESAARHLGRALGRGVQVKGAKLVRHKRGRRCLIEYEAQIRDDSGVVPATLLGKIRARGLDRSTPRVTEALARAGFGPASPDGIRVPETVGVVPALRMWLQRKVRGQPAGALLAGPGGPALARRIAEAAHKIHQARVPAEKRHTLADELRILHQRLPRVVALHPGWQARIARVLEACDRLGGSIEERATRGVHRDFHPDQVLVDGPVLFVVDFDQYCQGSPALDVGNFAAHLTELSLRTAGDPGALRACEQAFEERFLELAGEQWAPALRAYATLTLVRHVHISTGFEERRPWTGRLLELCEERLGIGTRGSPRPRGANREEARS